VAQHGGRDDRHFLRDWHSQAAEHEHGKNAKVSKVVDELLECLHGVLIHVSQVHAKDETRGTVARVKSRQYSFPDRHGDNP
jgi:hypothetical protein